MSNSRDVYLLTSKGLRYFSLNQADSALKYLKEAVAVGPNNALANHYLGVVYYNASQWDKAESRFRIAVNRASAFPDAKYYLALSLEKQRKYREAVKLYRQTIDLNYRYKEEAQAGVGRCMPYIRWLEMKEKGLLPPAADTAE